MKTNLTSKVNIEALLAKKEQITSKTIQAALAKLEETKQKAQEELVIQHLANIQQNTQEAVNTLRNIRAKEKAAKIYLTTLAEAEQAFYANTDYLEYQKSIYEALKEYRKSC